MSNSKMLKPLDDICCKNDDSQGFVDYAYKVTLTTLKGQYARAKKDLDAAEKRKEEAERKLKKAEEKNKLDDVTNHETKSPDPDNAQDVKDVVSEKLPDSDEDDERIGLHSLSIDSDTSSVACSDSDTQNSDSITQNSTATLVSSSDCSNDSIVASTETEPSDSKKTPLHKFKSRTSVIGKNCAVCEKSIQCTLHARKCITCKATVHEKCSDQLTGPCERPPETKRSVSDLDDLRIWGKRLIRKSASTRYNYPFCILHRIPKKKKAKAK